MIKEYYHRDRTLTFYDDTKSDSDKNIYTVIVGKNGSGKSTLLGSLIRDLLSGKRQKFLYKETDLGFFESNKGKVNVTKKPSQIIAVSTSPFDKFPLVRRLDSVKGYTYLGLRDLHSSNFGLAYLSKIISSLIESVLNTPSQAEDISKVLNYLGYHDTIRMRFNFQYTQRMLEEFIQIDDPIEYFEPRPRNVVRRINRRYFYDEEDNLCIEKIEKLRSIATKLLSISFNSDIQVEINRNGLEFDAFSTQFPEEISFLVQSGLLRLRDVSVQTLADSSLFSIRNASSGEQSVILGILAIASQIKNNSLICIDEPEICLHPQWQEKYIQILISTFSNYKNCHFIIATHSPQIISRLNDKNCFILSMEHGLAKNASEYIKNSADYQLARLFDSPGYKNEYLSRIALNIFSKVSKRKEFDKDDRESFKLLEYQSNFLDKRDPVYELYLSLKELFDIYG